MKIKPLPLRHILKHYVIVDNVLVRFEKGAPVNATALCLPEGARRQSISIKGTSYLLSRVVYAVANKVDPGKLFVDHINGDPTDDRPSNLRLATNSENQKNIHPRQESGVIGVSYIAGRGKKPWQARFKNSHLGYFETVDQAIAGQRIAELLIAEGWKLKRA